MAQTFDTSRVGGGTYELELDSTGNYSLKSVGFEAANKLNLPDLKTSDTSVADTTKKATEDTIKEQTTEVFKPTNVYQGGDGVGGQSNTSTPMLKTAKVNEPTVRNAGDPMTNIAYRQTEDIKALQNRADLAAPQESIGATDSIQPQSQDGILRGQTGVKYSKPPSLASKATSAVQNTVSGVVDSVKNNKALQMAGMVLGAIGGPIFTGAKMVAAMLPEETPTQKLNKRYFNADESTQRISGNPATDLYAGMNRTSDYGNLENAGNKRIATREATIAKREKTNKPMSDKFKADTEKMKNQAKDYKAQKTETQKATQGPAGGTGGGGGGSDSGRVICTDLHRTGELSTRDWIRDTKFTFKTLSITHVKGYLLWAEPTVRHIQKYPRYRKIWKHIAQHRANDIAWRLNEGKFDLLGRIYAGIGEPLCWALGNFVSDKQISKYNLTHWRRA
jgi:hypothetical protein